MVPQVAVSACSTMARICAQGPSPKSCTAGLSRRARERHQRRLPLQQLHQLLRWGTVRSAGANPLLVDAPSEHSQKCSMCCKGRSQTSTAVRMRGQGGTLGCLVGFTTEQLCAWVAAQA